MPGMARKAVPDSAATTAADILDRAGAAAALDEFSAKALLRSLGIATPAGVRVGVDADVGAAIAGLRPPYVLKALSDEALHKSDIGAVRLGLPDVAAVASACAEIAATMASAGHRLAGFLVEEMASPGVEVVIGGVTDPQLGPMVMLGAGGIYAEVFGDVSFRLCPIDARDAREMIDDLRIAAILKGARGRPPVDLAAIEQALLALGGEDGFFLRHADRVSEFDINPLFASPDGVTAVDARFVLRGGHDERH